MSLTCYRYWSMSQILEAIINEASQRVAQLKASGALHPEPHPYVRVVLNDFEYGEKGPGYSRAQWGSFEKEIWWGSALESASTVVEEHVDAAVAALPPALRDHPDARMGVVRLFQNVAFQVLEGKEWSGEEVREHIALLARSLRGEPVCVTVEADLGGVAVLTAPIELKVNGTRIRLRALTREDIEEEQPLEFQSLSKGRLSCHTSAILQLEYQAVDTSAWQRELNRAVAVLRLFGTGNVGYTVFRYRSESLLSISGGMASVDDGSGQRRTYAIREEDLDRLRRFWEVMWHSIPERFYRNKSNNPRDLAAAHFWYCGALAGSGWVNAQTAEVVRALESLFLREKAKQSISGTLRKRASKLLSACGLDEGEVDATLGLAYEVRSRYVHGDQLTKQDEERIRKQAGDIGVVLRRCLNYLRLALVAAITAGVDKDSLIIAVDAARDGNTRALQRIVDAFRTALPV